MMRLSSFLGLLLLSSCDDAPHYIDTPWHLDAVINFGQPISAAQVKLYSSDPEGRVLELVGETQSDAEGHLRFELEKPGDFVLVAELGGLSWRDPVEEVEGIFQEGFELRAPVNDVDYDDNREVIISPYTTLFLGVAEAWRAEGASRALSEARLGMVAHLSIDPLETPIAGEDHVGVLSDSVKHALLLEAFQGLRAQIAREAGMGTGALAPGILLKLLLEDAAGPDPGLFDGLGPKGPLKIEGMGSYSLSGETLRAELAQALEARLWSTLQQHDLLPLLQNLRCSRSTLFPPCQEPEVEDSTPPEIENPEPIPGTILSGIVNWSLEVSDPESGIASVRLEAAGIFIPLERREGDRFHFIIDSRQFQGRDSVLLHLEAENHLGGLSEEEFSYGLENIGVGILTGYVFKGPGQNLAVQAFALGGVEELPLGEAFSDERGFFSLKIAEYSGALRLEARGAPGHPQAESAPSAYQDEARDRALSWGGEQRMSALLPDFHPDQPLQIIISPLSDLAWAAASWEAEHGGPALLTAYEHALEILGAHFGLESPGAAEILLHILPSAEGAGFAQPLNEGDKLLLAHACFSQQALHFAQETLSEENIDEFSALDLLQVYREDIQADGLLDGRRGALSIELGPRGSLLLHDPFRAPWPMPAKLGS